MFFNSFALAIILRSTISVAQPQLRQQFPWYHTTDEVHSELVAVADGCSSAQVTLNTRTVSSGSDQAQFDVVYIKRGKSDGKKKAFFVFGEHARELVTTETALEFVKTLCGSSGSSNHELADRVLGNTDLILLPNANPFGRKMVESGAYCTRTNEDKVDLNRNWEDGPASNEEINPGPYAFSEPETQIIRDLVEEEKPDVFLSVHSGAYLLATPFGKDSKAPDNEQQMLDVLGPISQDFCSGECPYGELSDVIGYKSKGCDIDYLKEHLNTPYAFTWEIYTDKSLRHFYAEKARARTEGRAMKGDAAAFFNMNSLMLVQGSQHLRGQNSSNATHVESEDDMDCFRQFNPQSKEETQAVVENWAKAFMVLCDSVSSNGPGKKITATPTLDTASTDTSATDSSTHVGMLSRATPTLDTASTDTSATDSSTHVGMLSRFVSPHNGQDSWSPFTIHDSFTDEVESPLTKFLH